MAVLVLKILKQLKAHIFHALTHKLHAVVWQTLVRALAKVDAIAACVVAVGLVIVVVIHLDWFCAWIYCIHSLYVIGLSGTTLCDMPLGLRSVMAQCYTVASKRHPNGTQ